MAEMNKVLYNIDQRGDTSAEDKARARNNIGAAPSDILPPLAGKAGKFLKVNGGETGTEWGDDNDHTYNVFSTSSDGLVPKASGTGDTSKFLRGDCTWQDASQLPSHSGFSNAFLYTKDGTSVSWRRPTFGNIINVAKVVTATDITNGYVDIPFHWVDADKMIPVAGCFMFLNLWDASLDRGSTSISISSYVDKVKGSICTDTADWYSSDNAHGSDPEGMFFDSILGSELARIGGYPMLAKPVRKMGTAPNVITTMRGPSFRVTFATGSYQVQEDDEISLKGCIMAIYW